MRLVVLSVAIGVAASGCAGPSASQLGQMPILSTNTEPEASGTPSVAAQTLAAIAIETVTRRPAKKLNLLDVPGTAKKRSF